MNKVPGLTAAINKRPEITFETIDVTPELAKKWLETNSEGQRNMRRNAVATYARDMAMGNWAFTHQPIAFNEHGKLVDGQHRLNAVVESGATVRFVVSVVVGLSVHDPIDRGAKRSVADLLGEGWNNVRVATVGCLYALQLGQLLSRETRSKDEILLCYECNRDSLDALSKYCGGPRSLMTTGVIAGMAYAYPLHPDKVMAFAEQIKTGEGLTRTDIALTFRNWLINTKSVHRTYSSLEMALATCGVLARILRGETIRKDADFGKVFVAPTGYRFLTQKRRALSIPNTPSVEAVRSDNSSNRTDNLDRRQGGRRRSANDKDSE